MYALSVNFWNIWYDINQFDITKLGGKIAAEYILNHCAIMLSTESAYVCVFACARVCGECVGVSGRSLYYLEFYIKHNF